MISDRQRRINELRDELEQLEILEDRHIELMGHDSRRMSVSYNDDETFSFGIFEKGDMSTYFSEFDKLDGIKLRDFIDNMLDIDIEKPE